MEHKLNETFVVVDWDHAEPIPAKDIAQLEEKFPHQYDADTGNDSIAVVLSTDPNLNRDQVDELYNMYIENQMKDLWDEN